MILTFRENDGKTGARLTFGEKPIPNGAFLYRDGRYIRGGELGTIPDFANHRHAGHVLQHVGVNSISTAFAFTTAGKVTFNQTIGAASGSNIGTLVLSDATITDAGDVISLTVNNVLIGGHITPLDTTATVSTIEAANNEYGKLIAAGSTGGDLALYDTGGTSTKEIFRIRNAANYTKFAIVNDADWSTTQDNVLAIDMTNGNIGVGVQPAQIVDIQRDQSSLTSCRINNATAGAGAYTTFNVVSGTIGGDLAAFNATYHVTESAGKIELVADSNAIALKLRAHKSDASIEFYAGGNGADNKHMVLTSGGLLGLSTDDPMQNIGSSSGDLSSVNGIHVRSADGDISALVLEELNAGDKAGSCIYFAADNSVSSMCGYGNTGIKFGATEADLSYLYDQPNVEFIFGGTATQNANIFTIHGKANAASMADTRSSISFRQFYYHATTPGEIESGRITIGTEGNWTSTSTTQDSYLSLSTVLNGALTEKVRITSEGNIGIGTSSIDEKLHVQGTGKVQILAESDGTGDTNFGARESGTNLFALFNDHSDSKLRLANYLDEPIELSISRASGEKIIANFNTGGIEAPDRNFFSGELNFTSDDSVIEITPGNLHGFVMVN